MLKEFISNITTQDLFSKNEKLLLAFSGGVDSVVLAHLLLESNYKFELAHCNFCLRGEESEADEKFCKDFAKNNKLKLHFKKFDTKTYSKSKKVSIQMAARELRYNWFKELTKKNKFDYILTAHHANDNIETLLVNLTRGTGLNGLLGIPPKQKNIVRPLLFASKEAILFYAKQHTLKFRHDSSNDEVKYARNLLRHKVIPELKKLNPSLENTFRNNIKLFKEAALIVATYSDELKKKLIVKENGIIKISISKLLKSTSAELLLHEWLYPFGFNSSQTNQIYSSLKNHSPGKKFYAETHELLVDRALILVSPIEDKKKTDPIIIRKTSDFKKVPFISVAESTLSKKIIADKKTGLFDEALLKFPVVIRQWENGDKFRPLGMTGYKKISDFLVGLKMPLTEKKNVKVLCNANKEIVWVIGYRVDDRFKISSKTKSALKLVVN